MKEQTMEAGTTGPVTVGAISASAVVTALAGTLIALGSIGTWGRIEGSEQSDAILSGTVGGLALAEGKVTLALGLVVAALGLAWTIAPLVTAFAVDPVRDKYPSMLIAPLAILLSSTSERAAMASKHAAAGTSISNRVFRSYSRRAPPEPG